MLLLALFGQGQLLKTHGGGVSCRATELRSNAGHSADHPDPFTAANSRLRSLSCELRVSPTPCKKATLFVIVQQTMTGVDPFDDIDDETPRRTLPLKCPAPVLGSGLDGPSGTASGRRT